MVACGLLVVMHSANAGEGTIKVIMADNNSLPSAGDVPGSGRFGYPEGTIDDDADLRRGQQGSAVPGYTPGPIIIELPYSGRSCPTCLSAGVGNFMALSLKDELEHHKERHSGTQILYRCSRCGKEYQRKHPAECHIPKCPGPPAERVLPFECAICQRAFGTKVGLSQHERHEHPAVRNAARIAASTSDRPTGSTTTAATIRVFSEDDIEKMLQWEILWNGDGRIASRMAAELPGKSAKQIRDKRREPAYQRRRAALLHSQLEPEDNTLQQATTAPNPSSSLPRLEDRPEGFNAWRASLKENTMEVNLPDNTRNNNTLRSLVGRLKEAVSLACEGDEPVQQEALDLLYEEVVAYMLPQAPTRPPTERRGAGSSRPVSHTGSRRSRRKYRYARAQEMFRENPGLLAKHARCGTDWAVEGDQSSAPPADEVERFYTTLWGETPNIQLPAVECEEPIPLAAALPPFTVKEIKERARRMKKNVAAGPDGIKRCHLTAKHGPVVLQLLFNYILASGVIPSAWRTNRSTLLLKDGKDPNEVSNYRPITISSILSRLYWGLIDERLRQCVTITPRQKGFTSESGCFNNVHILNEILKSSKTKEGLVAVQLDVTKAFDTVPHEAIEWALRRKGLPEIAVRHVVDSYRDVYTVFRSSSGHVSVKIGRGIKQGDPLSPLIFNLVLEPLLLGLEELSGFKTSETTCISSLAFADDLMLTANNKSDAAELLRYTEAFLQGLGMELSAAKCMCFQILKTKESWCLVNPDLKLIGGVNIPFADEESRLEYLGMKISPWAGLDTADIRDALYTSCQRVKRLPLKPQQKLKLISTYIVPHYLYSLVIAVPPITLIRQMDQDLRVVYKEILHLPQSAADGLLYCAKRDGGLGLPKLEIVVTAASLRSGLRFMDSEDPIQRALAETSGMKERLKRAANAVRLNWPITVRDVELYKKRAKKNELSRWAKLHSQGKAVPSLTDDKIANAWLFNTKLLKPCRFITALKLRSNIAADKISLRRAGHQQNVDCRKCRGQPETLAHILGQCTSTKPARIRRHNDIRDLVIDEAVRKNPGIVVLKEPTLHLESGERLKPDLVLQNQDRVFVVDVTVRHEDKDYLERGRMEKIQKYTPLLPMLQQRFRKESATVLPIVVGTRGAMPKESVDVLNILNIKDRRTLQTISLMSLRSSIEIYHQFMDYDAPRGAGAALLQ